MKIIIKPGLSRWARKLRSLSGALKFKVALPQVLKRPLPPLSARPAGYAAPGVLCLAGGLIIIPRARDSLEGEGRPGPGLQDYYTILCGPIYRPVSCLCPVTGRRKLVLRAGKTFKRI